MESSGSRISGCRYARIHNAAKESPFTVPINNRYRPITRTDLSDSVNVKMPIKERKIGHGQTSVLIHRTRQAELLAYDVEEEEEEGQRRRCCE